MAAALPAAPGDVLAVWTGDNVAERAIRFGEWLRHLPAVADHVVIVTHQDEQGRWMGIQGQPGGVGLADCTPYLTDDRTRSNHDQPRADDQGQLQLFLTSAVKSLGIAYDWVGIAQDSLAAVGGVDLSKDIDPLWHWPTDHGLLPGHVVCSSLAAMLYDLSGVGWTHPSLGGERQCQPADWWAWSDRRAWTVAA